MELATIEAITRQRHNNPSSSTLAPYQRRSAMRISLTKSVAAVGRAIADRSNDIADIAVQELGALEGATLDRINNVEAHQLAHWRRRLRHLFLQIAKSARYNPGHVRACFRQLCAFLNEIDLMPNVM